jgi:hypothetical protein
LADLVDIGLLDVDVRYFLAEMRDWDEFEVSFGLKFCSLHPVRPGKVVRL